MHTQESAELAKVKQEKASTLVVTSTAADGSRDRMLAETMRRYKAEVPWAVWRVAHEPNIGDGWTAALGDDWRDFAYIHLMADDAYMEPGFWQAAVAAQERGVIPGPRALHPDGRLQSCGYEWERELQAGNPVPNLLSAFLTPAQLESVLPFPSLTLYIDFVITRRLLAAGYEIEHVPAFCYRHMGKVGGTHDVSKDEATYAALER